MKICVPVREKTQEKVLGILSDIGSSADLGEIWMDQVKDLDIKSLIQSSRVPLVCVLKTTEDKGSFEGSFEEMADKLIEAMKHGAAYIDIPLSMPESLNKKVIDSQTALTSSDNDNAKSRIIISHHDFQKTPDHDELMDIAEKMKKRGADVVKIAVMSRSLRDAMSVIFLAQRLQEKGIPHILIGMGKKGIITRVITPMLGGEMMFAPLTKSQSSASGQLTVEELKKVWKMIGIQ